MRITEVEALLLRQPGEIDAAAADGSQDALLVRVHTDEGLIGIGEVDSQPHVARAVIDAPASHKNATGLRLLLVGQDPLDVDALWRRMFEGSIYYGRRGVALHAISGIEIALWDIAGQAAGVPIHELLGGARRTKIGAYASTLMPDTPNEARMVAAAQREAGFGALKLGWGPLGEDADLDVSLVAAAREGLGDDAELMVDIGKGWVEVDDAIRRARRMEEYRLTWIEEPFWPDEYDKYRALAEAIDTPLAAGEEETTVWDFERLIDRSGVQIVQPDVTRAGGIRECVRIAALAQRNGRRLVTHSWSTGIIKAASLHVLAVIDEAEYFEYCVQTTELNQRLVRERFPVEDGFVAVPTAAGLGVTVDESVVSECLVTR
ncbi:MAG: L-rhamnonate dehydratase [Gaiellales bacterium]|nr:L-rhamnonate dehydratase [Gaiellales bacterium]